MSEAPEIRYEEFEEDGADQEGYFADALHFADQLQPPSAGGDSGSHLGVQSADQRSSHSRHSSRSGHSHHSKRSDGSGKSTQSKHSKPSKRLRHATDKPSGSATEAEQHATQHVAQVEPTQVAEPPDSGSESHKRRGKGKGRAVASSGHASSGPGSTARAAADNSRAGSRTSRHGAESPRSGSSRNPSMQPALSEVPPSDSDTFRSVNDQLDPELEFNLYPADSWPDPNMQVMQAIPEADEDGGERFDPTTASASDVKTSHWLIEHLEDNPEGRPGSSGFVAFSDPNQTYHREPSTFLHEINYGSQVPDISDPAAQEVYIKQMREGKRQRQQQDCLMHRLSEETLYKDEEWIVAGKESRVSLNTLSDASQKELKLIRGNIQKYWKCVQRKYTHYHEDLYTHDLALQRLGDHKARLVSEWVEKYRDHEKRYEAASEAVNAVARLTTRTVTARQVDLLKDAVTYVHDLHDRPKDTDLALLDCSCPGSVSWERRKVDEGVQAGDL